jgi:hypothetical protein
MSFANSTASQTPKSTPLFPCVASQIPKEILHKWNIEPDATKRVIKNWRLLDPDDGAIASINRYAIVASKDTKLKAWKNLAGTGSGILGEENLV